MKKLFFILVVLFCAVSSMAQTKYTLPYDTVIVTKPNGVGYLKAYKGNFADSLWHQALLAIGDSSRLVATTEWVKRQGYGTGGGGASLFPLTGTANAIGDVTGLLSGNQLRVEQDADNYTSFTPNTFNSHRDDGSTKTDHYQDAAEIDLFSSNVSNTISNGLSISQDGLLVNLAAGKTFNYAADYSSSYTNRSLVDKEYVDGLVSQESYLGQIYNKTSWADLTDFTNSGATVSVVGNKLQFSGGANTYTQTLGYTPATLLEHWKMTAKVLVGTKNGTSYGFGLGIRSTNTTNQSNFVGYFDMTSTGGDVTAAMGGGYNGVGNTSSSITFSASNYIILTVERNLDQYIVSATNPTVGTTVSQTFYRHSPAITSVQPENTGRFSIYSIGGTFTVDSLSIESYETKNANLMGIGDSQLWGYGLSAYSNRALDLLKGSFKSTIVSAGSGDKTIDVSGRISQIISLAPERVLLNIGENDIVNGVPFGTYSVRYDSIVTALQNAGITVYHLLPVPAGTATGIDVAPLANYIIATYPSNRIINNYYPLNANRPAYLQADSIHLNDAGNLLVYNNIFSSNLFTNGTAAPYQTFNTMGSGNVGDISKIITSQVSGVGIYSTNGTRNFISSNNKSFTSPLDLEISEANNLYVRQSGILRMQLSDGVVQFLGTGSNIFASGNTGEYRLVTNASASNELVAGPWGGSLNSNTVIVPAIAGTNNAKLQLGYFQGGGNGWMSGLELNNVTGGTSVFSNMYLLKSGGNVTIGSSSTPTARLQLPASTSTAGTGSLKFTTGTLPTTPETGLMNMVNGLWFIDSSTSVRDTIAGRRWVRENITSSGGSSTPAGNYGNVQLNRNGAFSTASSDSIGYTTSGGFVVKNSGDFTGRLLLKQSGSVNNVFVQGGNTTASGQNNIAIGASAGTAITSGSSNMLIGAGAGASIQGASNEVAIGTNAMNSNVSGVTSVGIGSFALQSSTGPSNAVAIGYQSLQLAGNSINGDVGIGTGALQNVTGNFNVGIGSNGANSLTSGGYNVVLGSFVDAASNTASGQLNIGNVLYGVNLYQTAAMSSTPTTSGKIGVRKTTPNSTIDIAGSFAAQYTSTATSISLDDTHYVVDVTATGQTITLPTAVGITGRIYTIKLTASGSCTVNTTSSQNIDGSATYSLASQYKFVTVQSTGSAWVVIGNN